YAVHCDDQNYIVTVDGYWFDNGFSWKDYTPYPGDSVWTQGIITERHDIYWEPYYTIEVIDFKAIYPTFLSPSDHITDTQEALIINNYPNPFNQSTQIVFEMSKAAHVQLSIFDALGNELAVLLKGYKPAGQHKIAFTEPRLASGIYYYRLIAGSDINTKKMIILK
ncbi:MAG: T9SS type A sorting domain-containing protein, partial [Caldithrix sp.]|nr:T9SS type A sorting domain-containing protein [Caldithrix sp.]